MISWLPSLKPSPGLQFQFLPRCKISKGSTPPSPRIRVCLLLLFQTWSHSPRRYWMSISCVISLTQFDAYINEYIRLSLLALELINNFWWNISFYLNYFRAGGVTTAVVTLLFGGIAAVYYGKRKLGESPWGIRRLHLRFSPFGGCERGNQSETFRWGITHSEHSLLSTRSHLSEGEKSHCKS